MPTNHFALKKPVKETPAETGKWTRLPRRARERCAGGQCPSAFPPRGPRRHPRKGCRERPQEPDGEPRPGQSGRRARKRPRPPCSGPEQRRASLGGSAAGAEGEAASRLPRTVRLREAAPSSRGSTASHRPSGHRSEEVSSPSRASQRLAPEARGFGSGGLAPLNFAWR
ncbi:balbiani ring protein 1-like [Hippopotamus amphibius kiboko]|uniref:balbiani ring protein 1-like n=1 Tax=Hippopotamus amphibius kiboko TaxID=575201 RepID=UPI00259969B0|nr:balbiani ring protein 1-like [Hippopotamus amphibius kiboko]